MIHYHGTPIGGKREEVPRFLKGRDALIPFARPEDLPTAAEVCRSFVLDNSAFSYWQNGGTLNFNDYVRWVREWHQHPNFAWALIPDVVDGTEEQNDSYVNRWPAEIRGVPVWHLHESLARLYMLCKRFHLVALGSSGQWATPGTDGWWRRMDEAMARICDSQGRPITKLHGLRMMSPEIFTRLPFSSADSTNVAQNSSGSRVYQPPTKSQRAEVIAWRIEAQQSAAVWTARVATRDLFELESA